MSVATAKVIKTARGLALQPVDAWGAGVVTSDRRVVVTFVPERGAKVAEGDFVTFDPNSGRNISKGRHQIMVVAVTPVDGAASVDRIIKALYALDLDHREVADAFPFPAPAWPQGVMPVKSAVSAADALKGLLARNDPQAAKIATMLAAHFGVK